jgi:hypothetical protein
MSQRLTIILAILLLALAKPAAADAIDGRWCDPGTKHLEIDGPTIVTPQGISLKGDYNRHGFKYQEPSDGKLIVMVLLNELTMRLKAGDGQEETWHRCAAPTSSLPAGTGNG